MKLNNSILELAENCSKSVLSEAFYNLIILLAPFSPHIAEELWSKLGSKDSVHKQKWPKYDPIALLKQTYDLVIQINGKFRGSVTVNSNSKKSELENIALESDISKKWIDGKEIKRIIVVPEKLVNIVI